MFWDRYIPKKYWTKPEVFALEIVHKEEGTEIYYTYLRNRQNKLELLTSGSCDTLDALPTTVLKNKLPLVLILNGKGLILKKISLEEGTEQNMETLIRQNLPAIQMEDFYVQLFRQGDHVAFLSLCRKNQLDEILPRLISAKYDVAEVFLGAPTVIGLEPLWTNFDSLATSSHKAELANNQLDVLLPEAPHTGKKMQIEELQFSPVHTLGFAGGLSYLLRRSPATNFPGELDRFLKQHTERNKFRVMMIGVVGLCFLLAVTNVFFYTTFFDKNAKLENELAVYQERYEQVNQLLGEYQKNKELIEEAGVLGRGKLSEYADRIGKTIPDEVVLSDLYFNPKQEEEESADSLVTFRNKSLVLKGNCSKSFIVNEWINVLKLQKFIRDVSLEKFVYNSEGFAPNFEIHLMTE